MTIIVTALIGVLSIILFRYSAGTLAIGRINLISFAFYLLVLQAYFGCLLVNCGLNGHYTLRYLIDTRSIDFVTHMLWVVMLLLPLTMVFVYRVAGFHPAEEYNNYLNKEIVEKDDNILFWTFFLVCVFQLICLIAMMAKIGYIPIWKYVFHDPSFDFATERIKIQEVVIFRNGILTNLVVKLSIPLMSYFIGAYTFVNRNLKWVSLFLLSFCMSVIVKTMDFSKSPLAIYFLVFIFIIIYSSRGGVKNKTVAFAGVGMIALLMMVYRIEGYKGTFLDLYNGIIGRTVFTQFGTLCYHFDLFPSVFPFLNGRSLSPTAMSLLGMDPSLHLRSAKLVMAYYGSDKVYDGTAGVMNALFIGEAYANWGLLAVLLSIVWVGIVLSSLFIIFVRIKKTPVSIALFAYLTQLFGTMIQGGFTDFIYNSTVLIVIIGGFVLLNYKSVLKKASIFQGLLSKDA